MRVEKIPLDIIDPPDNRHRIEFDENELQALAASIRGVGLINPITIKLKPDKRYEIIAGHRRWRAMHINGDAYIDAVISDNDDIQTEKVKFAENNIRANLTPMEEALAMSQMLEDDDLEIHELANQVSRSMHWVESRLGLLEYPDDLQKAVHDSIISLAAATELAYITDEKHRNYLMQYAIESGAAAGVLKQWRISWEQSVAANPDAPAPRPAEYIPGEPIQILIPCAICHEPTDHTKTNIIRSCRTCYRSLMGAMEVASSQQADG